MQPRLSLQREHNKIIESVIIVGNQDISETHARKLHGRPMHGRGGKRFGGTHPRAHMSETLDAKLTKKNLHLQWTLRWGTTNSLTSYGQI